MAGDGRGGENVMVLENREVLGSEEESARRWPVRERKAVERLLFPNSERVPARKGRGMPLKDIPNVAYNLSKRKYDDSLQMLHTILFGKISNKYYVKRNIRQFSGFVWANNEEKERARLKERIDKCVQENLFGFCELFDIHVSRALKKEELSEKLLRFLESPHVTTEVSLAEKEQKRARKDEVSETENHKDENEEQDDLLPKEEGSNPVSQVKKTRESQNTRRKGTSKEQVHCSLAKKGTAAHVEKGSTSTSARSKGKNMNQRLTSKSTRVQTGKFKAARANADPKKEELLPAIAQILNEVDLEVTTFEDIHKQLQDHFNINMSHRKVEVRRIVEESLLNMTVRKEEEEEDVENSADDDE